jgi:ATP-dependent Clp protease adaptor protein ClpS
MEEDVAVIDQTDDEIDFEEPKDFVVIFLNDNYTPMELVVEILKTVFHKTVVEANVIMMDVHTKGKAVAGTYTYDIALTKQSESMKLAKMLGFPLKVIIEEA